MSRRRRKRRSSGIVDSLFDLLEALNPFSWFD